MTCTILNLFKKRKEGQFNKKPNCIYSLAAYLFFEKLAAAVEKGRGSKIDHSVRRSQLCRRLTSRLRRRAGGAAKAAAELRVTFFRS